VKYSALSGPGPVVSGGEIVAGSAGGEGAAWSPKVLIGLTATTCEPSLVRSSAYTLSGPPRNSSRPCRGPPKACSSSASALSVRSTRNERSEA
jgi:hypothetical protein